MANNNVFISYARVDGLAFAEKLEEFISTDVEAFPFFDKKGIKPGDEWKKTIDRAIENCAVMLLVATSEALKSGFVTYEWAYALGHKKKVISLIIDTNVSENDLHPKLKDLQWMIFSEGKENHWNDLKEILLDILNENHVPDEVKNAVNDLSGSKQSDRAEAIKSLELLASPQADAALKNAINHPHPDVRIKAAIAFARRTNCEDMAVISGLGEALKDSNTKEFDQAIQLLLKMNNQIAAECLFNARNNHGDESSNGILQRYLIELTDIGVVPVLRQFKNTIDGFNFNILKRLAEFKDEEVLPDILNFLCLNNSTHQCNELVNLLNFYDKSEPVIQTLWQLMKHHQSFKNDANVDFFERALSILESTGNRSVMERLEISSTNISEEFNPRAKRLINMAASRMHRKLSFQPLS